MNAHVAVAAAFALGFSALGGAAPGETLKDAVKRAEQFENEGRFAESARLLETYAAEADGDVAFQLAQAHLFAVVNGMLPEQAAKADIGKARQWIDRALELGNPAAYQLLYSIYVNGFGVPADFERAVEYLRLGVAKNDPGCKLNWAVLAYRGTPPVQKDVSLAAQYFLESARRDVPHPIAIYYIGVMEFKGEAGQPKDEKAGMEMIEIAASHGMADAQRDMGKALEYGWADRKVDLPAALAWYAKAAENGDAHSEWRIGLAYAQGDYGSPDSTRAVEYFRRAVESGSRNGMTSLGVMYATGDGVPKDYEQARAWYEKAAEAGDTQAMKNLAVMYYEGQGVEVDLDKAVSLAMRARDDDVAGAADLVRLIEAKRKP